MKNTSICGVEIPLKLTMRAVGNYFAMTGQQYEDNFAIARRITKTPSELTESDYINITAMVYVCYESAMVASGKQPLGWDAFYAGLDYEEVVSAYTDIITNEYEKRQARFLHTQKGTSTQTENPTPVAK